MSDVNESVKTNGHSPESLVDLSTHWSDRLAYHDLSGRSTLDLLKARGGIRLDIGGGANPQPNFVSMDIRDIPDKTGIVWDFNVHPWPLPDGCVLTAMASHVLEHVPGTALDNGRTRFPFIEFMDDVWRVLRVGGEFMAVMPHGRSNGFLQDPTHVNAMNEARWAYFDPGLQPMNLWGIYQPKPWRLKILAYNPSANIEVVLVKRAEGDFSPSTPNGV